MFNIKNKNPVIIAGFFIALLKRTKINAMILAKEKK